MVYKARDDELFFYLPVDVVNCRPRECLVQRLESGGAFLGIARLRDLEQVEAELGEGRMDIVEVVEGVDLGRGRWTRAALFRPSEPADVGPVAP